MGKFPYKIQTAARCDGLPLKLKKLVAQNDMPLVGNNVLAADQASVNSTNVCTCSKMGSKTEQCFHLTPVGTNACFVRRTTKA